MEYNSIYRAIVTNNLDPEKRGRIKVLCPNILDDYESNWCVPCYPITGFNTGFFYLPDVNAPVWICFEEGDPDKPIWIGGWSIPNIPPPSEIDIKEQLKNPRKNIVKEDLLPSSLSKDRSLLNDFFGWVNKMGGIYWQRTLEDKYVFNLNVKDINIRGEVTEGGFLRFNYKDNKIILNDNSILLENGGTNITLSNSGININSADTINISSSKNVSISGDKVYIHERSV